MNELHNYNILEDRKLIEKVIIEFFKNNKYKKQINNYMNNIMTNGMIDFNLRMSLFS